MTGSDNKLAIGIVVTAGIVTVVAIAVLLIGKAPEKEQSGEQPALRAGMAAPNFRLPSTDGSKVSLASYRGKQRVLLYAHEGLACAPCVDQLATLEKLKPELAKLDVTPLSISPDPTDAQKLPVKKYKLSYPVLSHAGTSLTKDYDFYRFSMGHGDKPGHTFVLVDRDGTVQWRKDYWPGIGMNVPGGTMFVQGSEILSEVKRAVGPDGS
ncbi:MAG: redoxin domain-containing protein [bacterium]|nr:redoxin domain-containing protein [bacterium]